MRVPICFSTALLLLVACSKAPLPPKQPKQPQADETDSGEQAKADAKDGIARRSLEIVLAEGPAWLLARVPVEEVLSKGKFVGWRVQQLPHGWRNIDLRSGDVVKRVNGMAIDTPSKLWSAWSMLRVASELKVAYTRDGKAGELRMAIVGRPSQMPVQANAKAPAPEARPRRRGRRTVVIKGERHDSQPTVDYTRKTN
jgi:hypothetical protein